MLLEASGLPEGQVANEYASEVFINSGREEATTGIARWTDARLQGIIPFRRYCSLLLTMALISEEGE